MSLPEYHNPPLKTQGDAELAETVRKAFYSYPVYAEAALTELLVRLQAARRLLRSTPKRAKSVWFCVQCERQIENCSCTYATIPGETP